MENFNKPFDNFELLDCGGFYMTGVTKHFELEAAAMILATKNKDAQRFLSGYPKTIDEANKKMGECIMSFYEKKTLTYIIKAVDHFPMGFIHVFTPDNSTDIKDWLIEYYLNERFWRKGIMTAAVQTVLAFLQENNISNVKAVVDSENLASKRILEKLKFKLYARNSSNKEVYTINL